MKKINDYILMGMRQHRHALEIKVNNLFNMYKEGVIELDKLILELTDIQKILTDLEQNITLMSKNEQKD